MTPPDRRLAARRFGAVRIAIGVMLALGLAACAAAMQPMGRAVAPPSLRGDALIAADGYRLPLRSWLPEGPPRLVLLALHGFNDYSEAFDESAQRWAEHGIATYAYDQRGFGATAQPGVWAGSATLIADARQAIVLLHARHPGVPFAVLGDSMGGAVAIGALTATGAPQVTGLVLVAPALWGRDDLTVFERVGLWWAATFVPGLTLTGQGLGIQASDNIEMLRQRGRDPLVIKETRADTIDGLVDLMSLAAGRLPYLRVPTLVLYGEREEVLPLDVIDEMLHRLPPGPAVAFYPDGYHMLLRDLGRRTVQDDVAAWLFDHNAPLPSGADIRGRARMSQSATH